MAVRHTSDTLAKKISSTLSMKATDGFNRHEIRFLRRRWRCIQVHPPLPGPLHAVQTSQRGWATIGASSSGLPSRTWCRDTGRTLMHGSPRYQQSQGPVENANGDFENMLQSVLRENNTTDWNWFLEKVQWAKNVVYHRVIKMSPYKEVFGYDPPVSMTSGLVRRN